MNIGISLISIEEHTQLSHHYSVSYNSPVITVCKTALWTKQSENPTKMACQRVSLTALFWNLQPNSINDKIYYST